MKRSSGVLMPIFSLPSKYGIGCFSKSAYKFVDFLKESNQRYWQILPLGHTGYGDSPYQCFSAFAGNPYFISVEELMEENLLTLQELEKYNCENGEFIDYNLLYINRNKLLKLAYERFVKCKEYDYFINSNSWWLDDYSLFMAIKEDNQGKSWLEWNEKERLYNKRILKNKEQQLYNSINYYKFIQYEFYKEWNMLKKYANSNGISIIGDIPIYVSMDSQETWANTYLFQFDKNKKPKFVAGCPPDDFAKDGQLWGNPVYNWINKDVVKWWIKRINFSLNVYDCIRLDHFRGFESFYKIEFGKNNAINGKWEKAYGKKVFEKLKLKDKIVIAEDLGIINDEVNKLMKENSFYSTKVVQYGFDEYNNKYSIHNYENKSVCYSSTHDSQTLLQWINDLNNDKITDYVKLGTNDKRYLCESIISHLYMSNSDLCIISIWDYLYKNEEGRINVPSKLGDNWKWRVRKEELNEELLKRLKRYTIMYGRI